MNANPIEISQKVLFDRDLIDRYNQSGPRYTSYPTAPHFHEGFGPEGFRREVIRTTGENPETPLSLYIHIPFCDTVCYYCACNKVVTPDRSKAADYLEVLLKEIKLMGSLFDSRRQVLQLHLGGGTPTYLNMDQMQRLMTAINDHFNMMPKGQGEYGIEIDPREMPEGSVSRLADMGFNRISLGVQDLDYKVQKAVNRIQPLELSQRVVSEARSAGFSSINLDLIYGLPLQTESSFTTTLETVIRSLNPDRFAVFNYAHLPQYFMPQRRVKEEQLPTAEEKLRILESSINLLTDIGYVYVGMDHFSKPDDELAVAQRKGVLHRNFQGYTTHASCDLVGLGSTSISQIGRVYSQNLKEINLYSDLINSGELAIFRGLTLNRDDSIRREIIMRLICDFQLDRASIENKFGLIFESSFDQEMNTIRRMVDEGLIEEKGSLLKVTPGGRLLIRNICMVFDWYLTNAQQKKVFSRTI